MKKNILMFVLTLSMISLLVLTANAQISTANVNDLVDVNITDVKNDPTKTEKDSSKIFHLSDVDISAGKGAITSGVFIYFNLESKKAFLQTTISNNDVEITYLYRLINDKFLVGTNLGYFFNMPYIGPQAVFSPVKFIETFHWCGWSPGKPDGKIDVNNPIFLFGVTAASIKVWRFKATYCLINYMKNLPQHTVSLKYSQKVSEKFLIYTDVGYDFLNQNQLLKIGINWKQ